MGSSGNNGVASLSHAYPYKSSSSSSSAHGRSSAASGVSAFLWHSMTPRSNELSDYGTQLAQKAERALMRVRQQEQLQEQLQQEQRLLAPSTVAPTSTPTATP